MHKVYKDRTEAGQRAWLTRLRRGTGSREVFLANVQRAIKDRVIADQKRRWAFVDSLGADGAIKFGKRIGLASWEKRKALIAQVESLYETGENLAEACQKVGVPLSTYRGWAKRIERLMEENSRPAPEKKGPVFLEEYRVPITEKASLPLEEEEEEERHPKEVSEPKISEPKRSKGKFAILIGDVADLPSALSALKDFNKE